MPDAPQPAQRWSQREMALVYLGYKRGVESREPTAEELSEQKIRRGVALTLALLVLVIVGLILGPIAVIVVAVVCAAWWGLATRSDRRRAAAGAARSGDV